MISHNISFAGAGRVASTLSRKIYESGFNIESIVSLSEENGQQLATSCGARWSSDLQFPLSSGLIIVSVPDHALENVLEKLTCNPEALVVHTAGSIGLDVFPDHIKHKGVFYPLQTFSKGRTVDFKDLPLLLETSDIKSLTILEELALSIGARTYKVDTEQRIMLHLAAVFICNFTNHMLTEGKQIAVKAGIPFEILYPLLRETISKSIDIGPENSQTGPAVRNDRNTIKKHLELLSFSPELQNIYREITGSIIDYYNKI
jgi:predicted short-subunit dehydrogenase-like oxidoreductase (DUF2520 family)